MITEDESFLSAKQSVVSFRFFFATPLTTASRIQQLSHHGYHWLISVMRYCWSFHHYFSAHFFDATVSDNISKNNICDTLVYLGNIFDIQTTAAPVQLRSVPWRNPNSTGSSSAPLELNHYMLAVMPSHRDTGCFSQCIFTRTKYVAVLWKYKDASSVSDTFRQLLELGIIEKAPKVSDGPLLSYMPHQAV